MPGERPDGRADGTDGCCPLRGPPLALASPAGPLARDEPAGAARIHVNHRTLAARRQEPASTTIVHDQSVARVFAADGRDDRSLRPWSQFRSMWPRENPRHISSTDDAPGTRRETLTAAQACAMAARRLPHAPIGGQPANRPTQKTLRTKVLQFAASRPLYGHAVNNSQLTMRPAYRAREPRSKALFGSMSPECISVIPATGLPVAGTVEAGAPSRSPLPEDIHAHV